VVLEQAMLAPTLQIVINTLHYPFVLGVRGVSRCSFSKEASAILGKKRCRHPALESGGAVHMVVFGGMGVSKTPRTGVMDRVIVCNRYEVMRSI